MSLIHWFSTPSSSQSIDKRNFVYVQIDAIGVGLAASANPFLPIFLTRLEASSLEVGLLTAMPAVTGLLLAIPIGRFLQKQRNIIPWFSFSRLGVIVCYALTGLAGFLIPLEALTRSILVIWAIATIPQTILAITFSVVMNSVAGPEGRFELMTRRWSLLGITTTLTVFVIGQVLNLIIFPLNYQLVFLGVSLGGLISFYFSSHIRIPDFDPVIFPSVKSIRARIVAFLQPIFQEKAFISFLARRFVFMFGITLAAPLLPLYYVRQVHASDAAISIINVAQSAVLVIGYFLWTSVSRKKSTRIVLLLATLGLAINPFLISLTLDTRWLTFYAALAGIFQGGVDLVFFDELMKTIPVKYCATFVSFAQSTQYLSAIIAPLIGTLLGDTFSLSIALIISAGIRLAGFFLFLLGSRKTATVAMA